MQTAASLATASDVMTPLALTILQPTDESSVTQPYQRLVVSGSGSAAGKKLLETLEPQAILTRPIVRDDDARALVAGLWLWHDWLDTSHEISQSIANSTGSFWHAIMHRREGDFFNSKYWNARSRGHPAYATLASQAQPIITTAENHLGRWTGRLTRGGWDADAFVDFVEHAHDRPQEPAHATAVEMQRLEWRVLFDHCARSAVGA